jgi:rubrerythrin
MIKVFEDFDIALVGHYQSILESNGIETFMKNRFGTGGTGELPFVEVVPQLWVLNDDDERRARDLISELEGPGEGPQGEKWVCRECGTVLEAAFTDCWKCSAARPYS